MTKKYLALIILACLIVLAALYINLGPTRQRTAVSQVGSPPFSVTSVDTSRNPVVDEDRDEGRYNRDIESQELPEFESAVWNLGRVSPLAPSTRKWTAIDNPKISELPDTMKWNYFKPSSGRPFSKAEKEILVNRGFFLEQVPPLNSIGDDDMVDCYFSHKILEFGKDYSTVPLFITSDFLLHVYHVLFDRALQQAEERKLFFLVRDLSHKMSDAFVERFRSKGHKESDDPDLGNIAFFGIATSLLDTTFTIPPEARDRVVAELDLIYKAEGLKESSFTHKEEDYTQFRPRGHYTKSRRLSQYFRAMMWYGRTSFPTNSESATMMAIQQAQVLESTHLFESWKRLGGIYDYLVGAPDDLTCEDYRHLKLKIYGPGDVFIDPPDRAKLGQFMQEATLLSAPRISDRPLPNRQTPGSVVVSYRFFCQRFTPDARIFNDLTSPRVGSDAEPRNMPTGLDVMAVLGSPIAGEMMKRDFAIPQYEATLSHLKAEFSGYPDKTWTQNVYWNWLNSLKSLLEVKGDTYPFFARDQYWARKSLLTALASWAELKHDTILMSKQSGAEMGEGDEEIPPPLPPQPKGYVEPDIVFFNRFLDLVQITASAFSDSKILSDEYLRKFSLFFERTRNLREIVQKELQNQVITKEEYDQLLDFPGNISSVVIPDGSGDVIDDKFKQMALVADVHTDYFLGMALEEGVGVPQRIYVAVKDNSGGTRICVGYVYSYYEFSRPIEKRMTDDEWKAMIYPEVQREVKGWEPTWVASLRTQ
jgi:hypothetical protein